MPLDQQVSGTEHTLGIEKRKLEYFRDFIEQKFKKGLEYQIDSGTLEGIIAITLDISEKVSHTKGDTIDLVKANFNLRKKCSAALSLYQQPVYREIYIEKLSVIRAALKFLISIL